MGMMNPSLSNVRLQPVLCLLQLMKEDISIPVVQGECPAAEMDCRNASHLHQAHQIRHRVWKVFSSMTSIKISRCQGNSFLQALIYQRPIHVAQPSPVSPRLNPCCRTRSRVTLLPPCSPNPTPLSQTCTPSCFPAGGREVLGQAKSISQLCFSWKPPGQRSCLQTFGLPTAPPLRGFPNHHSHKCWAGNALAWSKVSSLTHRCKKQGSDFLQLAFLSALVRWNISVGLHHVHEETHEQADTQEGEAVSAEHSTIRKPSWGTCNSQLTFHHFCTANFTPPLFSKAAASSLVWHAILRLIF